MLMAVCHSSTTGWTEVENLDRLSELRAERGNLLWAEADVSNLTEGDVRTIAEEFGLHELAVEDAVHLRQRPKIDAYESHLFLVFHELQEEDGQLEAAQIACFIGPRYMLTIHSGADETLGEAKKRWRGSGTDLGVGSASLIHTMLDVAVDDYQRIADALENEIEGLEELVLDADESVQRQLHSIQRQLYSVKQRTARLRRYVFPMQRVIGQLISPLYEEHIPPETHVQFHDVQDHVLRIVDQVRNIDDLADAAIDLKRSSQAETLNDATKRLTGWAAIIAVPTLITGIYGMNLGLWPTVGSRWGFILVMAFIAVLCALMYVFFKKRDWI